MFRVEKFTGSQSDFRIIKKIEFEQKPESKKEEPKN